MKHFIEISKDEADMLTFLLSAHELRIKDGIKIEGPVDTDLDDYYTARSLRERLLNIFNESDHE